MERKWATLNVNFFILMDCNDESRFSLVFTNATEEKFVEMLKNYISENEEQIKLDVNKIKKYFHENGFSFGTISESGYLPDGM